MIIWGKGEPILIELVWIGLYWTGHSLKTEISIAMVRSNGEILLDKVGA